MKQLIHGGRVLTAGRLDGSHADLLIDGDTIAAVLPPGESVSSDASSSSECPEPGAWTRDPSASGTRTASPWPPSPFIG